MADLERLNSYILINTENSGLDIHSCMTITDEEQGQFKITLVHDTDALAMAETIAAQVDRGPDYPVTMNGEEVISTLLKPPEQSSDNECSLVIELQKY